VKKLAEVYFGRIPSQAKPDPVETVEPRQRGERRVTVEDPSQPHVVIGYHRPNVNHADGPVLETLAQIVGVGRTSRLYKRLVKKDKIAVSAESWSGRDKYPGLFMIWAVPAEGHTTQECEQAVYEEIERLRTGLVSPEELEKAKTRTRARLIRQLDSNGGLAAQLSFCEVITGDWRNLFRRLDKVEKVTAEDIQRVTKDYLVRRNRTVGAIETTAAQN
jgi:predicted Zn-dependent peptidase